MAIYIGKKTRQERVTKHLFYFFYVLSNFWIVFSKFWNFSISFSIDLFEFRE
jgi:hypothetical protein